LFWDNTNARLGIAKTPASPYKLDVNGAIQTNDYLMSPAVYSTGALFLGVVGGTVGFRLTTLLNTQLFGGATPSDTGQRLQVQGDAFIKGSGATSATNALTIQNSGSSPLLYVRNDGYTEVLNNFKVGGGVTFFGAAQLYISNNGGYVTNSNGAVLRYETSFNSGVSSPFAFTYNLFSAENGTATDITNTNFGGIFAPTSGTKTFNLITIAPLINQTGGANGITRGLRVNPTLTAAADWRSIEWSNNSGWGLYGAGTAPNYLGGSLGIGNTSVLTSSIRLFLGYDATRTYGIRSDAPISSGANSSINFSSATRISASVSTTNFTHYSSEEISIGAGSSITNHTSFYTGITTGANVYGFFGNIGNAANRWNLYMAGTADNYLAGKLVIGTTTVSTFALDVNGTARVSGAFTIGSEQLILSSGNARATINAVSSSIINFSIANTARMTLATSGLAINLAGEASPNASSILDLTSTTKGFLPPRMTTTQKNAISTPAAGLQVYDTTLNQMSYYNGTTWVNF
jgi:hypothetical protein